MAASPGVISAAEESTAWPGVSRPTYLGGLGFGFKWNMGWMHDTLRYMQQDPVYRRYHHNELTFSFVYAFTENFILPLSTMRSFTARARCIRRWSATTGRSSRTCGLSTATCGPTPARSCCSWAASWRRSRSGRHGVTALGAARVTEHAGVQSLVRDLNHVYREQPALWALDSEPDGFFWLEPNDADLNVVAFARQSRAARTSSCTSATSPPCRARAIASGCRARALARGGQHRFALLRRQRPGQLRWDRAEPVPWHGQPYSAELTIPPLAALWLVPDVEWLPVGAAARGRPFDAWTHRVRVRSPRTRAPRLILRPGRRRRRPALHAPACPAGARRIGIYDGAPMARRGDRLLLPLRSATVGCRTPLALAARGAARPIAGLTRAFRARARSSAAADRAGDLRATRRHLQQAAPSPAAIPHLPRSRSWASRRSSSCRWRSSRGARLGLRRGLFWARRILLRRPGRPPGTGRRRARDGLAVILDVVYNHVGASGHSGAGRLRPLLHGEVRDASGARRSTTTTPSAIRCASGCRSQPRAGSATFASTGCGSTRSTRSSTRARAHRRGGRQRVHALGRRKLVIAESGLNDPRVMRPHARGGYGCDAAWADDFHHALRTLITDDHDGYYAEFGRVGQPREGVSPALRDDGGYSRVPQAPLRRAGRRRPPRRFVVFCQDHDQVGNRAFGDRLPARGPRRSRPSACCSPRSRRCCSWARSTARTRPFSSSPTTSTSASPRRRARGAAREFAAFAAFGAGDPRPTGARDVRGVEAHA